jgi:dihydrofolate reductase
VTRFRYYTATSLDGFLADAHDSLDWLFVQQHDATGPGDMDAFMAQVGVLVMGATTYEWIVEHEVSQSKPWPYSQPSFVFTHRDLDPVHESITLVAGEPAEHRDALVDAAAGKDVWMVGGGDLAAAFARAGMLDEILVSIASVTLGSGRPLLGGAFALALQQVDRNGDFVVARYDVGAEHGWRA